MSNHERTATERPYLSIGEVLGLLLDEFPDVTISKIRFLESQGLIEPERTASGYRKFYDADVERLRFILREQRENYLPLKVIRDRLEGETPTGGISRTDPSGPVPRLDDTTILSRLDVEATDVVDTAGAGEVEPVAPDAPVAPAEPDAVDAVPSDADVRSHPAGSAPLPGATPPVEEPAPDEPVPDELQLELDAPPIEVAADPDPAPAPPPAPPPVPPRPMPGQLSRHELLSSAGIDSKLLDELESYGLVSPRSIGQQLVYDGAARQICEIAGAFSVHGIEVRHLRAWKSSAEREAGLFEQRILPLLRQRNPSAREHSAALLGEMATLGANLRHALVAQALQQYTAD